MVKCISKIRDNNKITKYILQDDNGYTKEFDAKDLKKEITNKKLKVENLQLTTDGRLIDSVRKFGPKELTISEMRAKQTDNIKYYQQIMDTLDIDIIAMFPMVIENPYEIEASIGKILKYISKDMYDTLTEGGKQFKIDKAFGDLLVNTPEKVAGLFANGTESSFKLDKNYYRGKSESFDVDFLKYEYTLRHYIAVLHKDGYLKSVMFTHVIYKNIAFSPEKTLLIIADNNGKLQTINIGCIRTKSECYKSAVAIMNSDFKNWYNLSTFRGLASSILSDSVCETETKMQINELVTKITAAPFLITSIILLFPAAFVYSIYKHNENLMS